MKQIAALIVAGTLTGCATFTQGTEQTMTVNSAPSGASCNINREGAKIAKVAKTPETIVVPKSVHSLNIQCRKSGAGEATKIVKSTLNPALAGNIKIGGVVGAAVDAASGAMNDYPKSVTVVFPGYKKKSKPESKPKTKPKKPGDPIS